MQVGDVFANVVGLGHDIDVVKAEVGQSQSRQEFERFVELVIGGGLIQRTAVPGTVETAGAENIGSFPVEGVPVAHRHAQVLLHGLAGDDALLVVIAIRQRILGLRSFELDRGDVAEI